mmetsp:Transcript_34385/g.83203  ORF Transcript_34385/g.83203 Transcript_34385/m.83203 type:complete len:232 (+) Transcript_34385:130-825(+)|eukprot:CAMPEP_0114499762 /NCGR_PEP_ID=MMETSP0109-20121206/7596_1 /TAXON_ID=29199 /ORGANISM="Chlorarachnion reptans, Strain CCCM449" /LENGTH=231 /DNA_ID=CAMNT_0001677363 /DNA_START=76 /DNA_END=771 /DNA_ORIENTATION=+
MSTTTFRVAIRSSLALNALLVVAFAYFLLSDDAESQMPQLRMRGPSLSSRRGMVLGGGASVASILLSQRRSADAANGRKFPPIDPNPDRCELATGGNNIGQSNAVSDRELDLRQCNLQKRNLAGKTLSGGLFQDGTFDEADFTEAVLSKAYAAKASFKNCDFSNSVLDRVVFDGSDLTGSKFTNAVITGASFDGANLSGTTFEDSVIGSQDLKRLCANPTLPKEVAEELGC